MGDEGLESIDDLAKMLSQALDGIGKVLEAMNNNLADIRIMLRADMESRTRIISTALEEFEKSHVVEDPLESAEGFSPTMLRALRKNPPPSYTTSEDFPKEVRSFKMPDKYEGPGVVRTAEAPCYDHQNVTNKDEVEDGPE